jgi:hypothetical protein
VEVGRYANDYDYHANHDQRGKEDIRRLSVELHLARKLAWHAVPHQLPARGSN